MSPRLFTRAVIAMLVLLAVALGIEGVRWWQRHELNEQIASGRLPAEAAGQPAALRFAQAQARAASGASEAALDRYRALQDDPELGDAARFNSANLLLRRAMDVRQSEQPGQAIPLIELAKQSYREILRRHPDHWPARYNLERAQRLLPDPEGDDLASSAPREAERAPTTMRAYSPGLP